MQQTRKEILDKHWAQDARVVRIVPGKAIAVNRTKEFVLAEHSAGVPHRLTAREKKLVLCVEVWKHGAPRAYYSVRSGFGERMRRRLETQSQVEAVEKYNSIT